MNVLEKIIAEIDDYLYEKYCIEGEDGISKIIYSHIDEMTVEHNEGGHVFIADKDFLNGQKSVSKEFLQECKEVADKYRKRNTDVSKEETIGWIPVEEGLPEEGTMVIGFQGGEMLIGELFIDKKTGDIIVSDYEETLRNISAWMPLPPKYEGE